MRPNDDNEWTGLLRKALDVPKEGLEAEIAARTALQVLDPQRDQLTYQIWTALQKHLPEMTGDVLDVGCYGGWLYPYVRNQAKYHGIDVWPASITAAKRMFGDELFEVKDVANYRKKHQVVWCTQLLNTGLWDKLRSLATRLVIYAGPGLTQPLPGATESYESDVNHVFVWRK